jgi:hypothetical protein
MTPKEKLWVGVFGFLLSNLSIVLTLYLSGHFGSNASTPEEPVLSGEERTARETTNAAIASKYAPEKHKVQPSRVGYVHTLSEAMYICADKLEASKSDVAKSYEFDYVASQFNEDSDIFHIFIDLETPSTASKGYERADVNCDVDAATRSVINFKISAK